MRLESLMVCLEVVWQGFVDLVKRQGVEKFGIFEKNFLFGRILSFYQAYGSTSNNLQTHPQGI
jgi:hypothetical protein